MEKLKKDKEILEDELKQAIVDFTLKHPQLCVRQIRLYNTACTIVESNTTFMSNIDVVAKIEMI